MAITVSREQFDEMVRQAIALLPDEFRAALDVVPIRVVDRPSPAQLAALDMDESELLFGLYDGIPLNERSVMDGVHLPDQITLFRNDLETFCETLEELREQVRITLFHELGHYFGFDEEQLDKLGYG